jgi:hydroxymethylbilane synthase
VSSSAPLCASCSSCKASLPSALRLATRGSALARWQADEVARLLEAAHPGLTVTPVVVSTDGDRRQDVPISALGGQGVFVKDVEIAVLDGRADAAVHSAKDLPSTTLAGLVLAAVPVRGDVRDALVGARLDDLAPGAPVATGSVRRRAQLAWLRPDLTFLDLRGNIATRLERVPAGGAAVVAAAALQRLGLADGAAEVLSVDVMLPQVGQGALAVECRADDAATAGLLAAIDDPRTRVCVDAERAFLARLGGGCDLPVGALARVDAAGEVVLEGLLASDDGRIVLRTQRRGPLAEAVAVAVAVAEELLESGRGVAALAFVVGDGSGENVGPGGGR